MDIHARSINRLVLFQVTEQVGLIKVETVSEDTSFVPPVSLKARNINRTVLISDKRVEVKDLWVETIGSAEEPPVSDMRGRSVTRTVLVSTVPQVSEVLVETIGRDNSFVLPGDLRSQNVQRTALVAPSISLVSSDVSIETIGGVSISVDASEIYVETISGLPYLTVAKDVFVETISQSTILPPQPQTTIVWFTVTNT